MLETNRFKKKQKQFVWFNIIYFYTMLKVLQYFSNTKYNSPTLYAFAKFVK